MTALLAGCIALRPTPMIILGSVQARLVPHLKNLKAVAADLSFKDDRAYDDCLKMAKRETRIKNGIQSVAIVIANHMHYPATREFLER